MRRFREKVAIDQPTTAEFNRIILLPDVQAKSLELGFEPVAWGPDRFNAFLADQMGKIKRLVDAGRVKA